MAHPADEIAAERLRIHNLLRAGGGGESFAEDVRRGLSAAEKRLPPKYFYDALGSQLFDAICLLPEYYLTRAEDEILSRSSDEIVEAAAGGDAAPLRLLELGSGSASKTRRLIEALLKRQPRLLYAPVDISPAALEQSALALLQSYPALRIEAYASDYETALKRLRRDGARPGGGGVGEESGEGGRTLALFLGSNVGNFDPGEAESFLRGVRGVLAAGDALLLGADLKKGREVLEAAYDDALGVTAAFNLNLLARINRELRADFDPRAFRHVALYNEGAGRVEIYVESVRAQEVTVGALGLAVRFGAGERIHTENSYKYDLGQLSRLAAATGFRLARTWTDGAGRFSSNLLTAV